MKEIYNKNLQELSQLKITQVMWYGTHTLQLKLSDGQTCTVGKQPVNRSHTFDPAKKITRVECIIKEDVYYVFQINFYHHTERLVAVGYDSDIDKQSGGRREVFEIADDEQLIGG